MTLDAMWLIFSLGPWSLGLPVTSVVKVWPLLRWVSLPGAPEGVVGAAQIGKRALPVLDLRVRLRLPPQQLHPRMVLIQLKAGDCEMLVLADNVRRLERAVATESPLQGSFWAGTVRAADGMVLIYDPQRLLSSAEERSLTPLLQELM